MVLLFAAAVLACGFGKLMGVETTELVCVSIVHTEQQVRLCSHFFVSATVSLCREASVSRG